MVRHADFLFQLLARAGVAAARLLKNQLILNALFNMARLTRHARTGRFQRQTDENQNIDNPEADIHLTVKLRHRRVTPEEAEERRIEADHIDDDMDKIEHHGVDARLFFAVPEHKAQH